MPLFFYLHLWQRIYVESKPLGLEMLTIDTFYTVFLGILVSLWVSLAILDEKNVLYLLNSHIITTPTVIHI